MIFKRFESPGLTHYSYIIGSRASKEIVVLDPRRDIDAYLEFAAANDLKITGVTETHIHADYASGAEILAQRVGAPLYLSAYDKGEQYEVKAPHTELKEGDTIAVGEHRLKAIHTPGHTPEHISFIVSPGEGLPPQGFLSGDFLFIGSVGRPDLLGENAKHELARKLYHSVREKLKSLPDSIEVLPAHGAGSMCGAGLSSKPSSSLGEQRRSNPYLAPDLTEEQFIALILGKVPPFPQYYLRMKQLNAEGAPAVSLSEMTRDIDIESVQKLKSSGAILIDLRHFLDFGRAHIPGSIAIGATPQFSMWASWLVPYGKPIVLVGEADSPYQEIVRALVRVGLDDVRGVLRGGFRAWAGAGLPIASLPQESPQALAQRIERGEPLDILDVRPEPEWNSGHIAGARHIACGEVGQNLESVKISDKTIAVCCAGGYRSTIAASVIMAAGRTKVVNLEGGMNAWLGAGLPVKYSTFQKSLPNEMRHSF